MKSNTKIVLYLIAIIVGMFGFGFAMVPLYTLLCEAVGISGKTKNEAFTLDPAHRIDKSRTITVQFLATRNDELPWVFEPKHTVVKMHPGETIETAYIAENLSGKDMVIQAIPSVAPGEAAPYIRKTECFCFSQQHFKKGEAMEMPLLFRLDHDLPERVHTISLSYTLFDAGRYAQKPEGEVGKLH